MKALVRAVAYDQPLPSIFYEHLFEETHDAGLRIRA